MKRPPFQPSEKGLTLIELIMALGILLPTLLVTLSVLMTAQRMSEDSRGRVRALNAARSTLETIKTTPLQSVPNINTANLVPADLTNGAIAIVTNPANLGGVSIATVTVVVSWRGSGNRSLALQFSTMRSRY